MLDNIQLAWIWKEGLHISLIIHPEHAQVFGLENYTNIISDYVKS
jgi:hypothetical protein